METVRAEKSLHPRSHQVQERSVHEIAYCQCLALLDIHLKQAHEVGHGERVDEVGSEIFVESDFAALRNVRCEDFMAMLNAGDALCSSNRVHCYLRSLYTQRIKL